MKKIYTSKKVCPVSDQVRSVESGFSVRIRPQSCTSLHDLIRNDSYQTHTRTQIDRPTFFVHIFFFFHWSPPEEEEEVEVVEVEKKRERRREKQSIKAWQGCEEAAAAVINGPHLIRYLPPESNARDFNSPQYQCMFSFSGTQKVFFFFTKSSVTVLLFSSLYGSIICSGFHVHKPHHRSCVANLWHPDSWMDNVLCIVLCNF